MLEEVVQALSPPFNPRMRTGVSVLFSLLQDDSPNGATVLGAIRTLLAASTTTQVRPGPSVGDVTHYRHASIAPRSQPSSPGQTVMQRRLSSEWKAAWVSD